MPDVTLDLGNQYIGSAYSPQVAITDTEDGHEVTFTFADSEHPGQLTTASYDVPTYADEEAEREAAEAARAAAESARTAAESARASAETGRATAEGEREDAEAARAAAETARAAAETARASAEQARASAEGSRASAEQARTSAESARASAEAGRAQAESARVSAEQARATAEQARAAAETARESAEATRQTNTAAAITRADAATSAANTATTNAQTATTAAQAATGEAETATDAANAAAALATAAAETVTDAYFPMFTAGAAEGITGGGPTDTAAWTYRACPGTDGPATIESIHGRTVRWNQLLAHSYEETIDGITWTSNANGSITITGANTGDGNRYPTTPLASGLPTGHTYLIRGANTANVGAGGPAGGYNLFLQYSDDVYSFAKQWGNSGLIVTPSAEHPSFQVRIQVGNKPSITFNDTFYPQLFDLTAMFGSGNEPSTVSEFEALYPEPYYPYDAGSLLSVQMDGIETVGFNQWDEQWELGTFNTTTGADNASTTQIRAKNLIPVLPNMEYYCNTGVGEMWIMLFDANKAPIAPPSGIPSVSGNSFNRKNNAFTTTADARYMRFYMTSTYGTTYNHDICVNLSWSGYRNGEYEPYWKSERTIPATDLRSAGTVYDELTETERITRVGEVDLGNQNWSKSGDCFYTIIADKAVGAYNIICSKYPTSADGALENGECVGNSSNNRVSIMDTTYTDAAAFKTAMSGVMLHYALATPTTTAIDLPLNLTYKAAAGGTERVTHTDPTAAPTLVVTYGSTADGIRDRALACIAHIENGKASANYGVGSYFIHAGQLCRVTTAIATGEAITIGTNVTATTVMAEVIALTQ